MNEASKAVKNFHENIQKYAPASTQPEKYNLYAGLANMARALEQQSSHIMALNRRIEQLERQLQRAPAEPAQPASRGSVFSKIEFQAD